MTKRLLLLSVLALFMQASAWAYDFSAKNDDGKTIYYNVTNAEELTCEVTYLSTSNSNYSAYQGSVVIPTTVNNESTTYSVTEIGDRAFSGCSALTAITLPESVTTIGSYAFYGCTGLTGELIIPNSVTSIGNYAFESCSGLTSVTIGESVTEIGNYAFYQCTGLTGELIIPNSVTSIGNRAFYQCTRLTSVTIPSSVTSIGNRAFYECSGLMSVTIGNSVKKIGDYAFAGCTGLTSVTIPNSVTSIGDYAFESCSGLTSVTIGESVTTIGSYAFDGCTGLTKVNFNAVACTSAGSSYSYRAFYSCNITTFNFGDNVTIIPAYLCYDCTGLTEITIPNSVTSIGSCAFESCTGLTKVNFNAVACTSAGSPSYNRAFYRCHNITTFNFGDNVTIIPAYLCYDFTRLTEIAIPNSVTTIGSSAFDGCSKLVVITSLNQEPPSCGSSAFYDVKTKTCILYVPEGSLGAYANASGWKDFYNIIEIEVDAIADITINGNAEAEGYYTLDGKQVPTLQRGINIIRYSDGTARKVLVK